MYSEKLTLLLVDDEKPSCDLLQMMIKDHCPEVRLIREAENIEEAKHRIEELEPDIIFLDVELPGSSGFELLPYIQASKTSIVFVTAYSQYAIQAIKAGASDYLLKPVDVEELTSVIKRICRNKSKAIETLHLPEQKLIISHLKGLKIVDTKNIIRLKADNNYTEIFLDEGHKIVASKSIKDFENKLDPGFFYRVHKSHLINLRHFREYQSDFGIDIALMSDGTKIPISRLKTSEFLHYLNRYATGL